MFDLSGRVALVTGAGQGVGSGIAEVLARQGAMVAVNDVETSRAEVTAAAIAARDHRGRAVAVPFDVTDADAVRAGVAAVESAFARGVDILVNNAGVPSTMDLQRFADTDPEAWRPYIDLNLYGSLHCIRATLGSMRAERWGRIIQISSSAGRTGTNIGISLYGAGKSAIEGFMRHLAVEVAADGVTANALALGLMDNAVGDAGGDDLVAQLGRRVPVGRLGSPRDAGAAVAYIASTEASWLTGQTIQLNGGQTTN